MCDLCVAFVCVIYVMCVCCVMCVCVWYMWSVNAYRRIKSEDKAKVVAVDWGMYLNAARTN